MLLLLLLLLLLPFLLLLLFFLLLSLAALLDFDSLPSLAAFAAFAALAAFTSYTGQKRQCHLYIDKSNLACRFLLFRTSSASLFFLHKYDNIFLLHAIFFFIILGVVLGGNVEVGP